VAAVRASEAEYMLGLAEGLASGEISEAEGLRRAGLYANRLRGTANAGFLRASQEAGLTLFWELGASEHCAECVRYAALSPWAASDLPTTPGEGATSCRSNCTCRLRREDGRLGFSREVVGAADGLASRDPREIIQIPFSAVGREMLLDARDLVAATFEAEMAPVTADVFVLPDGYYGRYVYSRRLIQIDARTPVPHLTFAHEFGHAVWKDFIAPTIGDKDPRVALPEFVKVYEDTDSVENIRTIIGEPKTEKAKSDLEYWTSPEEVFCRAFAQIVARTTQDPAILKDLNIQRPPAIKFPAHWAEDEFEPLEEYIVQWLKTFGVMKRA
jgi:hypothetical protein